jgi:hypothetical protein
MRATRPVASPPRADEEPARPDSGAPAAQPAAPSAQAPASPSEALARISAARQAVEAQRKELAAQLEEVATDRALLRARLQHTDAQIARLQQSLEDAPAELAKVHAALLIAAPTAEEAEARIGELQSKTAAWRRELAELERPDGPLAADEERLRHLDAVARELEAERASMQARMGDELSAAYGRELDEAKARREVAECELGEANEAERVIWDRATNELSQWPELLAGTRREREYLTRAAEATPLQRVAERWLAAFEILQRDGRQLPVVVQRTNVADVLELTARDIDLVCRQPYGPAFIDERKLRSLRDWASGEVREGRSDWGW